MRRVGGHCQSDGMEILFDFLNAKMDELAGLLETIEIDKEDTAESLADKIEKLIKEKMQGTINRIKRKIDG